MTVVDVVSQFLITSPFWLQGLIMFVVVVPLCAALAMVWLRLVDFIGATMFRVRTWFRYRRWYSVALRRPMVAGGNHEIMSCVLPEWLRFKGVCKGRKVSACGK